jgi:hypothetical protein
MSNGEDWYTFKESIMEAAFVVRSESHLGNGMFERDALASEMRVSDERAEQKRRFALAVGELLDEGHLSSEDSHASTLRIPST